MMKTSASRILTLSFMVTGVFLLWAPKVSSQGTPFEQLINTGIAYHDQGAYDSAIAIYQKALAIRPEAPIAHYEISYSYYEKGDYDKAISHCRKAMVVGDNSYLPAVIIYGSILDETGKTKQSIKVYKKALKTYPNNYLLHYNLAISYGNTRDLAKATYHATRAIYNNPSHGSSHLALAKIKYQEHDRVRSILPLYFFLLIEPDSERSDEALGLLFEQLNTGVSKQDDHNITITLSPQELKNKDQDFDNLNTLIKMMAATQYVTDSINSEYNWFCQTNQTILKSLDEKEKPGNKEDVWYDLYIPILATIANSKHYEAYCYYITQRRYDESREWLDDHVLQVDLMFQSINQ